MTRPGGTRRLLLLRVGQCQTTPRKSFCGKDAKDSVHQLAEGELLGHEISVGLQEYTMVVHPITVAAGKLKFTIKNTGAMTHEMVLIRAPSVEALPRVAVATSERAVGDVDEEAIPESDKPGEAEVKKGTTTTKTVNLTPGTYVMFCNIDTKLPDGAILNHFQRGMHQVITAATPPPGS